MNDPHICAFFATRDEQYRALLPFVTDGIGRGEKAVHIIDGASRADHVRRLAAAGVDVHDAETRRQLDILTWDDTYLRDGRFDQAAMLRLVEETLRRARDEGFPLTRLIAHMEWALQDRPGVGDLLEYEARASALLRRYPDPVICAYDRAGFDAELAMDIVRVHPTVMNGGALLPNPLFVTPDVFLGERAAHARTATKRRRFTARCIHCRHAILAGVERVGDEEASVLREHLRACRQVVPIDRQREEQLGRLLQHYTVAED